MTLSSAKDRDERRGLSARPTHLLGVEKRELEKKYLWFENSDYCRLAPTYVNVWTVLSLIIINKVVSITVKFVEKKTTYVTISTLYTIIGYEKALK